MFGFKMNGGQAAQSFKGADMGGKLGMIGSVLGGGSPFGLLGGAVMGKSGLGPLADLLMGGQQQQEEGGDAEAQLTELIKRLTHQGAPQVQAPDPTAPDASGRPRFGFGFNHGMGPR